MDPLNYFETFQIHPYLSYSEECTNLIIQILIDSYFSIWLFKNDIFSNDLLQSFKVAIVLEIVYFNSVMCSKVCLLSAITQNYKHSLFFVKHLNQYCYGNISGYRFIVPFIIINVKDEYTNSMHTSNHTSLVSISWIFIAFEINIK
jgi:hypothetical protein